MSDNASPADLEPEAPGFWEPVHAEVAAWVAKYGDGDDGDAD